MKGRFWSAVLVLALGLWLAPSGVEAAVAFDAVSSAVTSVASTSLSWTHTPVGTPSLVVVGVTIRKSATVTALTYGGISPTFIRRDTVADATTELWQLINPPTGAQTVSVTISLALSFAGGAITVTGSDTATPISNHAGAVGVSGTAPSVTVTSASGELVIDAVSLRSGVLPWTVGANQTKRWEQAASAAFGGSTAPGAATVTMSWTNTSLIAGWAISAASIKAAALSCAAVADATYVATNAQSGQAIVYWSSANPVIILRKTAAFAGEAPTNGVSYTAGATIGAATVIYDGTTAVAGTTCTATSCTQTGLTNGTTYYYKVFAKTGTGGSSCYAPGTVNTTPGVSARPAASPPAWSYMLAGGSMLKGGTAGNGALYVTSNASQIVSLNTANGTQSWAPAATTSPVQGWLTWIPPGPALVQQTTASVTSAQSLSLTLTSAPGNNRLLVMVGAALNGSLTVGTGVTGGGVATWTLASKSTTNTNVEIWYGITNGSSSTVTISTTAAAGQMWMHVSEWSGMATTGVLDQASAQPGTTSPASAPSITTTNANDLLIFGVGDKLPNTFGTPTPGTWTAMTSISITTRMQAEWYRVVSTTGAYAPTVSETGLAWDAAIAAFKASAAGGIAETVIGGDQSGNIYSVNTTTGATNWQVALTGADAIQAAVAAQIRSFSNAAFQAAYTDDVLFATTLNSAGAFTTNNKIFARRVSDGAVLWTFNSALTSSVDGIVGMPYVDYAQNRLYVASRAGSAGTQQSLWVLNTLDGTLVACPGCTGLGHLETSPTLSFNGLTLYVGSTAGTLYAINAATLTLKWSLALGTAITGFVWEDYVTTGRLYFAAADGTVRCIQDNGTSGAPCAGWTSPTVPGPSAPLELGKLFVGSWDPAAVVGQKGKLYQINLTTGAVEKTVVVGDGEKQPGDVSSETGNEVFVGTTEGTIYKFPLTAGSL